MRELLNNRFKLNEFNMNKIRKNHATIGVIAKRGSGKSYLTREIMSKINDIPATVIISKTEKLNKFYKDYLPDSYIYDEFDSTILQKIFKRQLKMIEDNQLRKKEGKPQKDDRVLIIMDDCMGSKGSWIKDENIQELFYNGRHYHITFILIMQYSVGIPPELRSNFDYIFLLAEDFVSNQKRLYEHYAGMFPTLDIFKQVFIDATDDFGCLVIDTKTKTKVLEDKVFWYKAKEVKDFHMGNSKFKEFHKDNYDPNYIKKIPLFNINTGKRNNTNIQVTKIKN